MSLTLRQIAKDLLSGKLPIAAQEDLAKARLTECERCPEFMKLARQCRQCGCFLDLKTKLLESSCPLGKW